ncbi:hypothetical protein HAHE_17140 [Haloferula helveola]|uniref:DUF3592 domain-containing protein n=1 Tax=Haloferula helveola TaxID=490095 RepID=A0ABN6H2H0_9BACT|nr:hypothetical protein HAHE_17140 [Haloferula helveola]
MGFWIGLCVTAFLVWAWVDSRGHMTVFGGRESPRSLLLNVYGSRVRLEISVPDASRYTSPAQPFEWVWERTEHFFVGEHGVIESPWFPAMKTDHLARYDSSTPPGAPLGTHTQELIFEGYEIHIPFVVVIPVWVALWLIFLGLYRRWQRKRATNSAAAEGP